MILEGVLSSGIDPAHAELVLDEQEAVEQALAMAGEGDLVVIGCADTEPLIRFIARKAEKLAPATSHGLKITMIGEPETTEQRNRPRNG